MNNATAGVFILAFIAFAAVMSFIQWVSGSIGIGFSTAANIIIRALMAMIVVSAFSRFALGAWIPDDARRIGAWLAAIAGGSWVALWPALTERGYQAAHIPTSLVGTSLADHWLDQLPWYATGLGQWGVAGLLIALACFLAFRDA